MTLAAQQPTSDPYATRSPKHRCRAASRLRCAPRRRRDLPPVESWPCAECSLLRSDCQVTPSSGRFARWPAGRTARGDTATDGTIRTVGESSMGKAPGFAAIEAHARAGMTRTSTRSGKPASSCSTRGRRRMEPCVPRTHTLSLVTSTERRGSSATTGRSGIRFRSPRNVPTRIRPTRIGSSRALPRRTCERVPAPPFARPTEDSETSRR